MPQSYIGPARDRNPRPAAATPVSETAPPSHVGNAQAHARFGHRFTQITTGTAPLQCEADSDRQAADLEGPVQRKSEAGPATRPGVPTASGGGQPLPPPVRGKMERSFGHSFADVRIHAGDEAKEVGALAYTRGENIHFQPSLYDPTSLGGQELLGHELTHVVQQRAGRVSAPQPKTDGAAPITADAGLEAEADLMGARAARSETASVSGAGTGIQRKAEADAPIQAKWAPVTIPAAVEKEAEDRRKAQEAARTKAGLLTLTESGNTDTLSESAGKVATGKSLSAKPPVSTPVVVSTPPKPKPMSYADMLLNKKPPVPTVTAPVMTPTLPKPQALSAAAGQIGGPLTAKGQKWLPLTDDAAAKAKDIPDVDPRTIPRTGKKWTPTAAVAPKIGVSHRDGYGFDSVALSGTKVPTAGLQNLNPTSLPVSAPIPTPEENNPKTPRDRKNELERQRMARVRQLRGTGATMENKVKQDLKTVNGLYIPGDPTANPTQTDTSQNAPKKGPETTERNSRDPYEQSLITRARNTGMPTLAVCGGSWRMLEAFGGQAKTLPNTQQGTHLQSLKSQSHGLSLTPNTALGGTSPTNTVNTAETPTHTVDQVNSTHWAVADTDRDGSLSARPGRAPGSTNPVALPPRPKGAPLPDANTPSPATVSELAVSAKAPDGNVEGFETRHGAPMLGVQWHPEAYRTGGARDAATPDAIAQSDELMRSFGQSASAYGAKQQVNQVIANSDEFEKARKSLKKV